MSLTGIKFQALPTKEQALKLSSWMGAAKTIWNAKCEEDKYQRTFARKFLPMGSFSEVNAMYSQYKNKELTPWLFECPSQILRNSASNWYFTYQDFFKKRCGRPKRKKAGQGQSILLTSELFKFIRNEITGKLELHIGTKKNKLGILKINYHTDSWEKSDLPKQITIKKLPSGKFTASFCYENPLLKSIELLEDETFFASLKLYSEDELKSRTVGVDRGINILAATTHATFNPNKKDLSRLRKHTRNLKRFQKKIAKQVKDSNRRFKTKRKIARAHERISNVRNNVAHHISKHIVDLPTDIIVLEDLKLKNMTKSAKGDSEKHGKNVKQKSGLNREILNKCLGKTETLVAYKAKKKGKYLFKVNPQNTSRECAVCGHTHPDNRQGIKFKCLSCGHQDHADHNAAQVIRKRFIQRIYSGTELPSTKEEGIGHGAKIRPSRAKVLLGTSVEVSKKKGRVKTAKKLV